MKPHNFSYNCPITNDYLNIWMISISYDTDVRDVVNF